MTVPDELMGLAAQIVKRHDLAVALIITHEGVSASAHSVPLTNQELADILIKLAGQFRLGQTTAHEL